MGSGPLWCADVLGANGVGANNRVCFSCQGKFCYGPEFMSGVITVSKLCNLHSGVYADQSLFIFLVKGQVL